jgi:hypothetical protein
MNKIIVTFFIILCVNSMMAQTRYIDEVFENYTKTEDVIYANAPDLPFIFFIESNTYDVDLDMDIYEPEGDHELQRPLIIFLYSGSFFTGSNNLDDIVALSKSAAKRGFVAMAINYRLGLNILSSYSGERAVFRGVQDLSAAIRYAREYHDEFRINPDKVFVWGSSAGAIIGLHLTISEEDERPESTYGQWGDPDLGCIDCEGNDYVHNSKPNGLISCWGAIGDLEWIDAENQTPTILFHGTADLIVPYDSGFPFTANITLPIVYGSFSISEKLQELGVNHEFYSADGEGHEYWGVVGGTWVGGPNDYFYQIQDDAYNFIYDYIVDTVSGDLNNDDNLNILDIVIMVNMILGIEEESALADINNDNVLNILDVVNLVNLILGR